MVLPGMSATDTARLGPTNSRELNQSQIPFGWISLDENDNDPGRFLAYLLASLNSLGIETDPDQTNLLQNLERRQIEAILNNLINQIADSQTQLGVVLDDYHHIQNQVVHQTLEYLLEHLPPVISIFQQMR